MPRFIMKANPTDDLYCEWSTVVDAPTWVGTHAELLAWLTEHRFSYNGAGAECLALHPEAAEKRIARADETGTSVQFRIGPVPEGSWADNGFVYMQQGWMPRDRLTAVLRRYLETLPEMPDVSDMLDPFEDESAEHDSNGYRLPT